MYPKLLIDILGWTGSILYLLAYALVSAKKAEGDSLYLEAYATTGLNVVWIAIGLFTPGRRWLTRN